MNVHLPTNFTSALFTVLVAASYPWNVHTPSKSASSTVVGFGFTAVTESFVIYLAGSVGNKLVTPAGNALPAVSLWNSYETLYSFALNVHLPTNFTSPLFTVLVGASYPWNVHTPSKSLSTYVT